MTDNNEEFEMSDDDLSRLSDATGRLQFGDLLNNAMSRTTLRQEPSAEPTHEGPRAPRPDLSQGSGTGAGREPLTPGQQFADFIARGMHRPY